MDRGSSTETDGPRVALVFDDTMDLAPVLGLARDLREQGRHVLLETRGKRLGKQLQDLEARGFRRIGVMGADGTVEWREPRAAGTEETKA
jgi:prolyl-tRNA synthetase